MHNWKVTSTNVAGVTTTQNSIFSIDNQKPNIKNLNLAGIGNIQGTNTSNTSNNVYHLHSSNRLPTLKGTATDPYFGSTKTNQNGIVDIFEKIASGPKSITLLMERLVSGNNYTHYSTKTINFSTLVDTQDVEKYKDFTISPSFPLINGYYKVTLTLTDMVGNSYKQPTFFLDLNSNYTKTLLDTVFEKEKKTENKEKQQQKEKETVEFTLGGEGKTNKTSVIIFSGLVLLVVTGVWWRKKSKSV
ncbi:hypothetical protein ISR94_00580 [Candidatus Microgenomates bacterium]|nr:hypothetical protein [Candidatus Microgenomates bacterium]